jgi:radical SAM protein with 4Fe4S-binding SPASM domain
MATRLTWREKKYLQTNLSCVRHITLDPKGPGVVRIHMIPPKAADHKTPFLLLLNGAQLIPLDVSWAILLANFMDAIAAWQGKEIEEHEWEAVAKAAIAATRKTYPFTKGERLADDLKTMLDALIAIARGEEPKVPVGVLSLGEYAPEMTAPHRMDLMLSAMVKNGVWHCNQKCLHCYAAGQPMGETPELSTEQWKAVLEKLRAANIPQVTFTGGEPTLRSDLVELVDSAQWFVTRLNTNGRLLTPELCAALYKASLDSVQITLYSSDAATHNALVGAQGFTDTVQGIRNAVAAGLNVSINTPLCSRNADYAKTLEFAASLGVRYATCSGLIPAGGAAGEESQTTRLSCDELKECLQYAMEVADSLTMEIDFTSPGWLSEDTLHALGLHLVPSCGACLSNMAIAPDGMVVPCQSWLGGVTLGNIFKDDWDAIWQNADCAEIRAESAKMEQICQLYTGNRAGKGGC